MVNNLSFEIKTTADFFKKLLEDYDEYCKDKTNSRLAINCSMTAWHMTEWVFHEFNQHSAIAKYPKFKDFEDDIKKQCQALQIMHDITNGTKHYKLTKHVPDVDKTELHKGAFSNDFSRAFDISCLVVELKDGTRVYFEDEIEKVKNFWRHYLNTEFNISV